MSDVTAPPPSPAPQSAPINQPTSNNEVPINQNPPSSQNPVTNTPPEKPAEDRATSRKAALQRAFDRASDPEAAKAKTASRPPPKPAEAKPGHNQPPEQLELDLKKRPADQPRGDRGQFAPRAQGNNGTADPGNRPGTAGEQATTSQRLPPHAPFAEPPARMDDAAKAEWHATPERVRGSIYRMHQEFQNAYQQYRGAAEAFEPVRQYHQMAQAHGTTLDRALHNYVSMEQKLRQDVIGGLDVIVNNLNLKAANGQKLNFRDICHHVLNQSPEQRQLVQQQNAQQAAAAQIGSLHQEISGLKNQLQQLHTGLQFNYTRAQVDQIADDGRHPRFDELGGLIERELQLGFDIETAYRRAELLQPATHAAQTGTASAQTRPPDKSISGAPDVSPSNGASRRNGKPVGRREAIQNAIRRAGGAL